MGVDVKQPLGKKILQFLLIDHFVVSCDFK
jgi:hypothetical protein